VHERLPQRLACSGEIEHVARLKVREDLVRPLSAMTAVGTFPAHLEPEVERNLQRLIGVVVQRKGEVRTERGASSGCATKDGGPQVSAERHRRVLPRKRHGAVFCLIPSGLSSWRLVGRKGLTVHAAGRRARVYPGLYPLLSCRPRLSLSSVRAMAEDSEARLDVSTLKELARKSLVDALNAVRTLLDDAAPLFR
jgi:hypothetical protein